MPMMLNDENLLYAIELGSIAMQDFLCDRKPVAGLILGSGLNPFANALQNKSRLEYEDVPFMEVSTAEGHEGCFLLGTLPGTDRWVLCMQGRLHKYEGNSAMQIAFPVWLMAQCGIQTLITTNAAGALNRDIQVGDFCIMADQINFTGTNPLVGRSADLLNNRFVPMKDCFDAELREIAKQVALREEVSVKEGVYIGVLGPSLETPAEVRMFARLGADTIAMSVVEEVIAARHAGMRVLGMSLVTNMGCGIEGSDPNSEEIMFVGRSREDAFFRLMTGILREL